MGGKNGYFFSYPKLGFGKMFSLGAICNCFICYMFNFIWEENGSDLNYCKIA